MKSSLLSTTLCVLASASLALGSPIQAARSSDAGAAPTNPPTFDTGAIARREPPPPKHPDIPEWVKWCEIKRTADPKCYCDWHTIGGDSLCHDPYLPTCEECGMECEIAGKGKCHEQMLGSSDEVVAAPTTLTFESPSKEYEDHPPEDPHSWKTRCDRKRTIDPTCRCDPDAKPDIIGIDCDPSLPTCEECGWPCERCIHPPVRAT